MATETVDETAEKAQKRSIIDRTGHIVLGRVLEDRIKVDKSKMMLFAVFGNQVQKTFYVLSPILYATFPSYFKILGQKR